MGSRKVLVLFVLTMFHCFQAKKTQTERGIKSKMQRYKE